MLLHTKVILQLVHDKDMLNIIEKMERGGLCFVGSQRYVQANNKHMGQYYDPHKESNYIEYEDANNLYGCRMSDYSPYKTSSMS